jgi:ATP-dependent RNA helicase DeaD
MTDTDDTTTNNPGGEQTPPAGGIPGSAANNPAADQAPAADAAPDDEQGSLPALSLEDLPDILQAAARSLGWTTLMPVQTKGIPYLLEGRDVMVQARTGSGKTGAFVLPILKLIDPAVAATQALVLVPTRELAQQVAREADALSKGTGVNVAAVYGGVGYGQQIEAFEKGAHLVVGTPGRILDHLLKRSLVLKRLSTLVFDEADRMMSMGFYPDMVALLRYLPDRRSSFMFSATFPVGVRNLSKQFLSNPEFISLSHGTVHIADMEHIWYEVPAMDKDRCLVRIIEVENPDSAIIFCNTKDKVNYVATVLQRFGYDADQLTADLSQVARDRVMERLRKGNLRFLVATDVASRGIDIPALSHVFLYEFPEDPESYIHRAGRTARAGAAGTAVSLASLTETGDLSRAARRYSIDMVKKPVPTEEDVAQVVTERMTVMLEAKLRERDRLQVERMKRFLPLARTLSEDQDELDLLAMLLDDYYHESLHAPASPVEYEKPEPRKPREHGGSGGGGRSGGGSGFGGGGGGGGGGRGPRKRRR